MAEGVAPDRNGNWLDWGGSGPPLHFAHANGFPPATYRRLIESLRTSYHVVSMEARPLWPGSRPEELTDWLQLADDLREQINARGLRGAAAVGHSLGAVTSLLAAVEDPGLFQAVVAIDPIVLAGWLSLMWGTMKAVGLGWRLPIVRGARRRRDHWPNRDAVRESYVRKRAFRHWDRAVLDDYLLTGLVSGPDGGVALRYPKRWEARIFRVAPHDLWPQLRRLEVRSLFVRGEHSDTLLPAAARKVGREVPGARVAAVPDTGHFLPMERPDEVARVVLEFLDGVVL